MRKEIEEEERSLAEKVEQQRIKYEERLDQLEERERADFVRMKKDMIQRVNLAATDFRKTSDQQVPPTIKRAIRENQQVQSALKKMEINCNGKLFNKYKKTADFKSATFVLFHDFRD